MDEGVLKMSAEKFRTVVGNGRERRQSCDSRCSTYLRRPEDNELDYGPTPDAARYDSTTSLLL